MVDPNNLALPELPIFALPPLPPIANEELGRLARTHSSAHGGTRRANAIELGESEAIQDYEKLEHVGDGILGSIVTTLLHELFPQLPPGPATVLKASLVANSTLAQLSTRYNMPDSIIAAPSALFTTRLQTKTRASVFEAYIAAMFYDFLLSELPGEYVLERAVNDTVSTADATADGASVRDDITESAGVGSVSGDSVASDDTEMTKVPDTPTVDTTYSGHVMNDAPERNGARSSSVGIGRMPPLAPLRPLPMRTRGEAYDYVERWLRPLFEPIAQFALDALRNEAAATTTADPASAEHDIQQITGAAACLNQWSMQQTGKMPRYEAEPVDKLWRVIVAVVTKDGIQHVAEAVRSNQKLAKNHAAYSLCRELNLDLGSR